jgi:hypothetical protein
MEIAYRTPVAGRLFHFFWLATLSARTLEDRRPPDNGNPARCGEATWRDDATIGSTVTQKLEVAFPANQSATR